MSRKPIVGLLKSIAAGVGLTLALLNIIPLLGAQAAPSIAGTYTVDRVDDTASASACTGAANDCSLRGAIIKANSNAGSTVIVLTGTYVLTDSVNGDLAVFTNTIIQGAGAANTIIQGGPGWSDRIFYLGDKVVQLSGVTLRYGRRTGEGGAIYADAIVSLSDINFISNTSTNEAGAVYLSNFPGVSVTLKNLTFISNTAGFGGGAVWCNGCRASIDDSLFRDNRAGVYGGAVVVNSAPSQLTLNNDQLLHNDAQNGGAVMNYGALTMTNNTLSFNYSCCSAGAVYNQFSSTLLISASIFSSNTTDSEGGAIYNASGGVLTIEASQLVSNAVVNPSYNGGAIANNGSLNINGSQILKNSSLARAGAINNYGQLTITFSTLSRNTSVSTGGAIDNRGQVLLAHSQLISNTAGSSGGALYNQDGGVSLQSSQVLSNSGGNGGGLANDSSLSSLTLTLSTVAGNHGGNGGGIENYGSLLIESSAVRSNASTSDGGGLYSNGSAIISNSQIMSNVISSTIASGGGIAVYGSTSVLTLTHSSVAYNRAPFGGGLSNFNRILLIDHSAIYNNTATQQGGGIDNYGGWLTLINSTLSGNAAQTSGGGVMFAHPSLTPTIVLQNDTIVNNIADSDNDGTGNGGGISQTNNISVTLIDTLLANNIDRGGQAPDCSGSIISLGYNLIKSTTGCTLLGDLTGVITNTDPIVTALQDNGGSTWTHALIKGSPAIDAGDPANCPSTDQRDVARPIGPHCDLGAVEGYLNVIYLPLVLKNF